MEIIASAPAAGGNSREGGAEKIDCSERGAAGLLRVFEGPARGRGSRRKESLQKVQQSQNSSLITPPL